MAQPIPHIEPSLQTYFVDKTTGLPLTAGIVTFYQDQNRTVKKTIYTITGSPPDYTWTALPNPITLSAVGTIVDDDGNDILPYYFPYQGTPDDSDGTIENYYITVEDQDHLLQFTREGFPFADASGESQGTTVHNYVPNGQFVLHNLIPSCTSNGFVPGKVYSNITLLGQGGWYFERSGSTGIQIITFPRYDQVETDPESDPRYAVQIEQTSGGTDTIKDLELEFPFVTSFASDTLEYTFYFEASSTVDISVSLIKKYYYGTSSDSGPTPSGSSEVPVETFTIGSAVSAKTFTFQFPSDYLSDKTIGDNNDDSITLALRFPNSIFMATLTNFALVQSTEALNGFPMQTIHEQLSPSTAGSIPTPNTPSENGFNLYLPVVMGPEGFTFDYYEVGRIVTSFHKNANVGELLADGSIYRANDYSGQLIPYARLGAAIWDMNQLNYFFGTGPNYYTAVYPSSTGVGASLRITQNAEGVVTTFTDVNSGITSAVIYTGVDPVANPYYSSAYVNGSNSLIIQSDYYNTSGTGPTTSQDASTFTLVTIDGNENENIINDSVIRNLYQVQFPAAASITGGTSYFTYTVTTNALSVSRKNTVWYAKDGAGSQPVVGGTTIYIKVNVLSTDTSTDVTQKTWAAINNCDSIALTIVAASTLGTGGTGKSFTLQSQNTAYKFQYWFNVDGGQSAPVATAGYTLVEIPVNAADTAAQVAVKLMGSYNDRYQGFDVQFKEGINSYYYQVPDLRGWMLRGWDDGSGTDTEAATRYSYIANYYGDNPGTYQLDFVRQHYHAAGVLDQYASTPTNNNLVYSTSPTQQTSNFGNSENTVKNISVTWMIKY